MRRSVARIFILITLFTVAPAAVTMAEQLPAQDAWTALEEGNASKAAAIFRDALDRSPDNPILLFGSAQASLALGRTDAAISALKRAVQRDPKFLQAHVLLAQVVYSTADLDLAVRSLERAVALAPRDRELSSYLERWRKEIGRAGSETELRTVIRDGIRDLLQSVGPSAAAASPEAGEPRVIFVVGVNGVGKTTTIGKLAHRFRKEGRKVLLVAGDTFRAAAVEQLTRWAERSGSDLVKHQHGADPSAGRVGE